MAGPIRRHGGYPAVPGNSVEHIMRAVLPYMDNPVSYAGRAEWSVTFMLTDDGMTLVSPPGNEEDGFHKKMRKRSAER